MSFASLKKSSMANFKQLAETMQQEVRGKERFEDDRFWTPAIDKNGNGFATIRFLPTVADEQKPYVKILNHGFNIGKRWFIENCPGTINRPCPVCEHVIGLWATDKAKASARKQVTRFISNIYIVSDQKQPENEGKVFLYKYGTTIFGKLMSAIRPEFEDEQSFNPFNFWEGANFKLKIRNVDGNRNYDKCEFASCGPLLDDDSELEDIWNKEYRLEEFLEPTKFKSYDELKIKLTNILEGSPPILPQKIIEENEENEDNETEDLSWEKPKPKKPDESKKTPVEDDDAFETWAKLIDD